MKIAGAKTNKYYL